MSVRLKIALTLFATGLVTALAVVLTVALAFQRFERETTYQRACAFLDRVAALHENLLDMHARHPEEFSAFLQNLVLFEVDTQLYLLDTDGTVLSSTGNTNLPPGFKVALAPVQQSIKWRTSHVVVMGDDPERMDADAIVAAIPLRRWVIRNDQPVAGYLYLVAHKNTPQGRWQALQTSFARPAMWLIAAIVAFTTALAALVVASVTRPLRRLTLAVSALSEKGLQDGASEEPVALPPVTPDEFGQLTRAFGAMLATVRRQWDALRRLDHFRREAVSNLSHDLRSPLTATVACLETLQARWAANPSRADSEEHRLTEVALRNTRNAARMVKSLGDLAKLEEPTFQLRPERVNLEEMLDGIAMRFAERAARQGVTLEALHGSGPDIAASVDVELFERAIANLVDNALKFCGPGCRVTLQAEIADGRPQVTVADSGPGIAADDLPHLFDRFYQARNSVMPATAEGGKGLGLAIVKRIAELHGGDVAVHSAPGQGTQVTWWIGQPDSLPQGNC